MIDESQKVAVLQFVLDRYGVDKYNRLISIVDETVGRGEFRFWQEQLLSKLHEETEIAINSVDEYAKVFRDAPYATKDVTLEEFLAEPSRYYYTEPVVIPDEWVAKAWEQSESFRENVTYEFSREARKNGDLSCLEESLRQLASILPMNRNIDIYRSIRDMSPHRESEFRPTFDRIFGDQMTEFPVPFTDQQLVEMFGHEMAREMGIGQPPQ